MRRFHKQGGRRQALAAAALGLGFGLWLVAGATTAQAQVPNVNLIPETKTKSPEEREQDAVTDKAYRESLRKIPNKTVSDPWGDVRSTEAPRAAAPKNAAPKATQAKRQSKADGATN